MNSKTRAPLPSPAEIVKLPPDGGPEFNRLVHERSPYLLQHARNPVDWFPWGEEAFAKAKRENKTIFLSVGYSSCHWCHVMEHESFEDAGVAKLLNELFVPVKVDREERPDLDDIYMAATQLMTGHGGWPNSVWLMPDGRPWYAGTYFPREDRGGRPGFKSILLRLSNVWTNQNAAAVEQAEVLSAAIRENAAVTNRPYAGPLDGIVSNALGELAHRYDDAHGGFGTAPKFPPHASLLLLLDQRPVTSDPRRKLLTGTLDAMQLGGIHDHIGGGFARYSTDARWFLPHFEKMLYDNGQLAKIYAQAAVAETFLSPTDSKTETGMSPLRSYAATARGICDWVLRDMTGPEGGFYSALDADSEGVEGKFYVWSRAEILKVLGEADGELFCRTYNVTVTGNYHEEATGESTGLNIPFLTKPVTADGDKLAACREKLRAVRAKRIWPMLDDKVLTAWNGLMIGGLAVAGKNLNEPRYTAAAEKCAKFLLTTMWKDGQLLRSYRAGKAAIPGYLDDYANLADGLLDLADATGKAEYRESARKIAGAMVSHFYDTEHGGFFTTAPHHEKLITRQKDSFDSAAPSGNGIAAIVLLRLADQSNNFRKLATETIRVNGEMLRRAPTGCGSLVRALAMAQASQPKSEALAVAETEHVRAELFLDAGAGSPGSIITGRVVLVIAEKFHLNANPAANAELIPTTLSLAGNRSVKLAQVEYPRGSAKAELAGRVELPMKLHVEHAAKAEPVELTFDLRFQPCDATACFRPATLSLRAMVELQR